MNFESGAIEWILPLSLLALGGGMALGEIRRSTAIAAIGDPVRIAQMGNSLSRSRRLVRSVLVIAAILLCVLALANPRNAGKTEFQQHGMDIVFIHDFSVSMLAEDVYPNRLDRALREAESLSGDLMADRIASVLFAGGSVHFPLTHDHDAARQLYQGVRPADIAAGADIGQAIQRGYCILKSESAGGACEVFRRAGGGETLYGETTALVRAQWPQVRDRSSVILLFSDGEDLRGRAEAEADVARSLGIELFVIALGKQEGELMRDLAGVVENRFFSLGEGAFDRTGLLAQLNTLKRGDLSTREIEAPYSLYDRFLLVAFLLLLMEGLLSSRRRRVHLG